MSMHLLPAHINSNGSGKRKVNKKQQRSIAAHEEWLRKQGLHSSQIKAKRKNEQKSTCNATAEQFIRKVSVKTSDTVGNGFVRSIFEDTRNESPKVREEIMRKASRTAPLYNKGPVQFVTEGTDVTQIGSKSRRG